MKQKIKPVKDKNYYRKIFDEFWNNQFNYVPVCGIHGDVEHLIELNDSYPPYWFATSHGRVFSVYGSKFKQLKPHHVLAGRNRNENKWYYIQSKGKHRYIHQMVAEHCCENPYGKDVKAEVHHITPVKKFGVDDAFIANQAGSLQWLPKNIHDQVGEFARTEPEEFFEACLQKTQEVVVVPDLTEWVFRNLQYMQKQGVPVVANVFENKDVNGEWYKNHDIAYRGLNNVTVERIEE